MREIYDNRQLKTKSREKYPTKQTGKTQQQD